MNYRSGDVILKASDFKGASNFVNGVDIAK